MNWVLWDDIEMSEDDYGMQFLVRDNFGDTTLCEWSSFGFVVVLKEPTDMSNNYVLEHLSNIVEVLRIPLR